MTTPTNLLISYDAGGGCAGQCTAEYDSANGNWSGDGGANFSGVTVLSDSVSGHIILWNGTGSCSGNKVFRKDSGGSPLGAYSQNAPGTGSATVVAAP